MYVAKLCIINFIVRGAVTLRYKKYKNSNLREEVGIAIQSKETSSQLEPVEKL